MRKLIPLLSLCCIALACNEPAAILPAENGTDAAREFIRAALDGDYVKASSYMLQDSTNVMLLKQQDENYNGFTAVEKSNYRNASIRPVLITKENDSLIYFRYYHSALTTDTTNLRVIRQNNTWLVDLKSVIKM